jgi:CHAT domain-containing protein/Tfp pilus assembly protein PilF
MYCRMPRIAAFSAFILIFFHFFAAPMRADEWSDLMQQFNALHDGGKFSDEDQVVRQMLAIANEEQNQVRIAASLGFSGIAANDMGRFSDAVSFDLRSIELWKKTNGPESDVVAEVLGNLAGAYQRQGKYAEADQTVQKSLALKEKLYGHNDPRVATDLNLLGVMHYRQGRFDKSEAYYKQALTIFENTLGADDPQTAMVLDNLASVYDDQGRHSDAEPLYKRALAIRERTLGRDHILVAASLNNLAELYREQGQYAEAEPLFQRCLIIKERELGPDHTDVAESLANLALLYENQGKHDKAEPLYKRSLAIDEKVLGPDHPFVANSLNNLGALYDTKKNYAQAEPLYQRALEIREKQLGPDSPFVAGSLQNVAGVYVDQEKYEQAAPLLDRAVSILEKANNPDYLFRAYDYRADLNWKTGHREQAVADLARALGVAEQMRGNVAGAENERAAFFSWYTPSFERMIDWQNQLGHLDEALRAAERSRARTLIDQMNVQGANLLLGLPPEQAAQLQQRENAAKAKLAALESQLDVLPKRNDLTEAQKKEEELRLVEQTKTAREEEVEAYRDIRNASPACRLMLGKDFKPVSLDELQTWVKDQNALLLQYSLGDKDGFLFVINGDEKPQLVKLEITKEQAEELNAGGHAAGNAPNEKGKTESSKSKTNEVLDPGPLTAARAKLALTIDGQDLPQRLSQPDNDETLNARLAALWKVLIPDAQREALINGKYKRLILVPDGALVNLPFEALVVELRDNPVYLLDRGPPVIEGPSATLLYNLSQRETAQHTSMKEPVLTVGNPKYPAQRPGTASNNSSSRSAGAILASMRPGSRYATRGSLKPLPNSGTEVAWVAEAFSKVGYLANKLLQADATEANVRNRMAGREIVHLACHGLVDSEHGNFFGALALTPGPKAASNPADDGFLTLPEIYELNLKGCELAILSACQTNYGPEQRGEGVWALSRGFLVAGSRRVVASNWLVDDEAAASLVYFFCSKVAQQDKSVQTGANADAVDYAQALHDAKVWVRSQQKWHSPYYWATFTLIGPK